MWVRSIDAFRSSLIVDKILFSYLNYRTNSWRFSCISSFCYPGCIFPLRIAFLLLLFLLLLYSNSSWSCSFSFCSSSFSRSKQLVMLSCVWILFCNAFCMDLVSGNNFSIWPSPRLACLEVTYDCFFFMKAFSLSQYLSIRSFEFCLIWASVQFIRSLWSNGWMMSITFSVSYTPPSPFE